MSFQSPNQQHQNKYQTKQRH